MSVFKGDGESHEPSSQEFSTCQLLEVNVVQTLKNAAPANLQATLIKFKTIYLFNLPLDKTPPQNDVRIGKFLEMKLKLLDSSSVPIEGETLG